MEKRYQNEILETLLNHRSVRQFQDRPIPEDLLETLLTAGVRAATGGNLQQYSLLVIDDPATKAQLNAVDQYHNFDQIPLIIIALADTYRLQRWFEINDADPVNPNEAAGFFIANWDALIALHNITIAAESLGLGAFYNGNVLMMNTQELFDAPASTFPAGMLCIGYPKTEVTTDQRLSVRLPLEAVVHRNQYRRHTDEEIRELYQEREEIWERVPVSRKEEMAKQGIFCLPQALAKQKFTQETCEQRGRLVAENLKRSGFNLFYK